MRLFRLCVRPIPSLPWFSLSRFYTFLARYNTWSRVSQFPATDLLPSCRGCTLTHTDAKPRRGLFTHVRRVHTCRNRRAPQSESRTASFDVSFCALLLLLILRPNIAISNFDVISSGVSSRRVRTILRQQIRKLSSRKNVQIYNCIFVNFVSLFEGGEI